MVQMPEEFRPEAESPIASYDYTDIEEGTGVRVYDLFASKDSATTDYHMSRAISDGGDEFRIYKANGTETFNVDFDILYNLPQDLKGRAYFFYTLWAENENMSIYPQITLHHVDSGNNETTIEATITGQTLTSPGAAQEVATRYCVTLDIDPLVHFAPGEKLRLELNVVCTDLGAGSGAVAIYFDPSNRAIYSGDTTSSTFQAHLPFDLDA